MPVLIFLYTRYIK